MCFGLLNSAHGANHGDTSIMSAEDCAGPGLAGVLTIQVGQYLHNQCVPASVSAEEEGRIRMTGHRRRSSHVFWSCHSGLYGTVFHIGGVRMHNNQ